jgi:tetratricopeptide (TPR) repeat protein
LVLLSYLLDFRTPVGQGTRMAHIANLLFHMATTLLVWRLAKRLTGPAGDWPAAGAAALFAVHPVHVESVNWISGRADVLAALFFVAASLAALQWRDCRSKAALASMGVCVLFALMAKEIALAALLVIPALWWLAPTALSGSPVRTGGVEAPGIAVLVLACAVYFAARTFAGVGAGTALDIGPVLVVLGLARTIGWYLLKLIVPWPQHNLVGWELLPGVAVAGLLVLLAAAGVALAAQRWRRDRDGVPLLALAWMLLTLAPSLWIALSAGTRAPVAERYLYLPSVGAALGVGWALAACRARWTRWVTAALVVAYAAGAFAWGLTWSSDVRLWSDTVTKSPRDAFAWHSLARAWRNAGDEERALATYRQAIDVTDDAYERPKLLYAMAEIYLGRGDYARSGELLARADREAPNFVRSGYALGLIAILQAGDSPAPEAFASRAAAAQRFRRALSAAPDLLEARVALAQARVSEAAAQEAAGNAGAAAGCYGAAAGDLRALEKRIHPVQLAAHLRNAEPGLERDVPALRGRAEAAARRLREAGVAMSRCPL